MQGGRWKAHTIACKKIIDSHTHQSLMMGKKSRFQLFRGLIMVWGNTGFILYTPRIGNESLSPLEIIELFSTSNIKCLCHLSTFIITIFCFWRLLIYLEGKFNILSQTVTSHLKCTLSRHACNVLKYVGFFVCSIMLKALRKDYSFQPFHLIIMACRKTLQWPFVFFFLFFMVLMFCVF